jgi:hypothetical protein
MEVSQEVSTVSQVTQKHEFSFQPTDSDSQQNPIGGKQIFRYRGDYISPDHPLLVQLQKAQIHAIRKIREQHRQLVLAGEIKSKKGTPEPIAKIEPQDLTSVEKVAEVLSQQQQRLLEVEVAANWTRFAQMTPEWSQYHNSDNGALIREWVLRHADNTPPSTSDFLAGFAALKSSGLLTINEVTPLAPVPVAQTDASQYTQPITPQYPPQPAQATPVHPSETQESVDQFRRVRSGSSPNISVASSLNNRIASSRFSGDEQFAQSAPSSGLSRKALEDMSGDEYKKYLQNESTRKHAEQVFGKRKGPQPEQF